MCSVVSVVTKSNHCDRTYLAPPPSQSNCNKREPSHSLSLPERIVDQYFDPLEAAKQLLKNQEEIIAVTKPPPKEGGDKVNKADEEEDLQVIMEAAPPEEQLESIKEHLRWYKIIKKKSQPKYKAAAPVPQASNNKRKRDNKIPPTQYKNKPSNLPKHKKRKVVNQTVDKEEEEEKWRQVADFARAFNGIKQILDN
ncbi:hypothetical protein VP01_3306g2 [Puccinia sorghi]|uniref:Uncharacterized protein n=1 Tax=Puccinia sorghi TaxID=27349 RepID=A0A0L6UXE0_9BASI|nr:hypothetical protein VP01_3306g2 [Puccinia sorghi]